MMKHLLLFTTGSTIFNLSEHLQTYGTNIHLYTKNNHMKKVKKGKTCTVWGKGGGVRDSDFIYRGHFPVAATRRCP